MKISYMAFQKRMTIQELFFSAILKSYNKFVKDGLIKEDKQHVDNGKRIL